MSRKNAEGVLSSQLRLRELRFKKLFECQLVSVRFCWHFKALKYRITMLLALNKWRHNLESAPKTGFPRRVKGCLLFKTGGVSSSRSSESILVCRDASRPPG